jgi:beta-N-acetylhexosaminidase
MIATLKHFPGHGDTDVDSHLGLPVILHARARLDEIELPPFRAGIDAGAGAVMTSHIALPALDPTPGTPATFSPPIVMSLLRGELAFGGLIVTDSMEMQGVARLLSPGEAAVRAVLAGHDVLIDLPDTQAAFEGIKAAVQAGRLSGARIGESAERILRVKASLGLHKRKQVALDEVPKLVGARAHRAVAQAVSERSITLLKDERNTVPLRLGADASILYLSVLDYPGGWGFGAPSRILAPELRKRWPRLTAVELSDRSTAAELDLVRATADRYDAIVAAVFVRTAAFSGRMDLSPALVRMLNELARRARGANTPFVGILFGNPYVAMSLPDLPAMLLTYDYYDLAEGSAARALAGEAAIGGRLPIALPGLFPIGHGVTREAVRATAGR